MAKHLNILGWLYIALGALSLIPGIIVLMVFLGIGMFGTMDVPELAFFPLFGGIIFLFLAAISIPSLIVGIGLLRRWPWIRIPAIIVAIINIFNPPLGTALSIYTFWVLFKEESKRILSVGPAPAM